MCPQVAAIVLVIQRCPNVGEGDIFEQLSYFQDGSSYGFDVVCKFGSSSRDLKAAMWWWWVPARGCEMNICENIVLNIFSMF